MWKHSSGAEQAAEKGPNSTEIPEKHTEGRIDSAALTARLMSCPDASCAPEWVFSQPVNSGDFFGRGILAEHGAVTTDAEIEAALERAKLHDGDPLAQTVEHIPGLKIET